jgi:AcrR family transcriptional regulator
MSVAERRSLLIDAAIAVMSREGVGHTTTRAIVAEAGMQIGVFHYCFRSKEELILEVMKRITERSFEAVGEVLQHTQDASRLIEGSIEAYWSHIHRNPLEHLLTYELTHYALRQPGNEDAATEQYATYIGSMELFLAAVAEQAGFAWRTSVEVLARLVLAMIEGVTFQWLVNRDDDRARLLLEQLSEHLHRDAGLTRAPATTPR